MQKRISVVIPTYNRSSILKRCLDALTAQTLPKNEFEVVVCDDGSKDDTQEIISAFSNKLSIQSLQQENRGPAAARNRAMAVSKAPLLLIINDDSILAKDALERHLNAEAYHTITLGNFRTPPDLKQDFFSALVDSTTWIFPFVKMRKAGVYGFDLFLTANLSLPAAAVKEVGGFDENFPSPAGEDIELGYRLSKAGYVINYDPSIECSHHSLFTPRGFAQLRRMRGVEDMRFLHKHPTLIGHYQEWCSAIARRWHARLQKHPAELSDLVQKNTQQLDETVSEYGKTDPSHSAKRFKLIEKAYKILDYVGTMAFVEGITKSDYFENVIGPHAVPFASSASPSTEDLISLSLKKVA